VFTLPADVAGAVLDRLGVAAPTDVAGAGALLGRLARTFPAGTTAKMEALAAGAVPPGADPAAVVAEWVARPGLAWSCWAAATVFAALVHAGGGLRADVVGARRIDLKAPPVDVHTLVVLHDGDRSWVADPYFGVPPIAASGGTATRPGVWGRAVTDGPVWRTAVAPCSARSVLRYRSLTLPLDRADVEAFCRISVTHTGVSPRPWAQLVTDDGGAVAAVDRSGAVVMRRWSGLTTAWGSVPSVSVLASWTAAEAAMAELAMGELATA
jgi:hypothetical protein